MSSVVKCSGIEGFLQLINKGPACFCLSLQYLQCCESCVKHIPTTVAHSPLARPGCPVVPARCSDHGAAARVAGAAWSEHHKAAQTRWLISSPLIGPSSEEIGFYKPGPNRIANSCFNSCFNTFAKSMDCLLACSPGRLWASLLIQAGGTPGTTGAL